MLGLLNAIHSVIPSYGLTMILLALVVRVALWPLANQQFKSMAEMQQVQTQKIMAIVSPVMIAYFGWRYKWASALLIYWLALNVFTLAQQLWMYRKYGLLGGKSSVPAPVEEALPALKGGKNGAARQN